MTLKSLTRSSKHLLRALSLLFYPAYSSLGGRSRKACAESLLEGGRLPGMLCALSMGKGIYTFMPGNLTLQSLLLFYLIVMYAVVIIALEQNHFCLNYMRHAVQK